MLYGVNTSTLEQGPQVQASSTAMRHPSYLLCLIPTSLTRPALHCQSMSKMFALDYDRGYFEAHGLAVPSRLEDLVRPEYRGQLIVENPLTLGGGGLGFSVRHGCSFWSGRLLRFLDKAGLANLGVGGRFPGRAGVLHGIHRHGRRTPDHRLLRNHPRG